jgi:hypothetical protein
MSACGHFLVGVSKDAGKTFTWNEIPGARTDRNKDALAAEEKNVPGCAGSIVGAGCPETFQLYARNDWRSTGTARSTLYWTITG